MSVAQSVRAFATQAECLVFDLSRKSSAAKRSATDVSVMSPKR